MDKPKYQVLLEHLEKLILTGVLKPGDKLYSENQLAERFNLSRHTVRSAIGFLENRGLVVRKQGMGNFIAERNKTVGIVTTFLSDYIFPELIKGLDLSLSARGYQYTLSCTFDQFDKEKAVLLSLLEQNISACIIEPTKSMLPNPNRNLYDKLNGRGVKFFFLHAYYPDFDAPYLTQDDFGGGSIACRHLIEFGFKKIGGIFDYPNLQGQMRCRGAKKELEDASLPANDEDFLQFIDYDIDSFFIQEKNNRRWINRNLLREFLNSHDAIITFNEKVLLLIYPILKETGGEWGLVSFDDTNLAKALDITTIIHPQRQFGQMAGERLADILEGIPCQEKTVLEPRLVVRETLKKFILH